MTILQAIVLGVVQGLTEFLPISSDGHLSLVYALFGMPPDLTYEVFLHGATLLAMYVYFWRDIGGLASSLFPGQAHRRADRRIVALIVAGTLVSGVVAKLLEPIVEPMSADLMWVGIWFAGTAAVMFAAEAIAPHVSRRQTGELTWASTGFIGLLQGLAVLPGLSRSGSTISAGMMTGLDRESAARFSFLLGIPIISVAFGLDALDVVRGGDSLPGLVPSIAGFVAAGLSGYVAITGLLRFVKNHKLYPFAIYTACLAAILLTYVALGKG